MPKPDAKDIIKEARRLKDEKFGKRDTELRERQKLRFREVPSDIPDAYKDTATDYRSPIIQDEGTQVASLIFAVPVPHVVPPTPEMQPQTTTMEQFMQSFHQEAESEHGSVIWKNTEAQIHQKISWVYWAPKRDAYAGGPKTPGDDASIDDLVDFGQKYDQYKRANGLATQCDYRHVPTDTMYTRGDYRNPLAVYEVKEVDERDLILQYDLVKDGSGRLSKPDLTTMPSGYAQDAYKAQNRTLRVIEYWDREWCMILVENGSAQWRGSINSADALVLEEWEHGWGRVPYFGAPAFENEVLQEEYRYESPLDPLYAEVPLYNSLRRMQSNVAYLKGYPTWQDTSKESAEPVLDAQGNRKTHTKFIPGVIYHTDPGHEIKPVPMQTGDELLQEVVASEARLKQFSLSDVSKGISPGADTANSAITQLRRLQRSALSPMSKNQADQWREAYKFWFARIKEDIGETVYVYDREQGEMIELAPEDIVTMNLQVKVAPDTGQDNLIEEKQAFDLWKNGGITEIEFHERRGKENPEEYVKANLVEDVWAAQKPTLITNVLANLGNNEAAAQLIAQSQQSGEARDAVPEIMRSIRGQTEGQPSGMGQGSGGMPRQQGVRQQAVQQTTQPGPNGVNAFA